MKGSGSSLRKQEATSQHRQLPKRQFQCKSLYHALKILSRLLSYDDLKGMINTVKSILEELYNGSVYPAERICPTDPEYRPVNNEIGEIKKYFKNKMSEKDLKLFEKLENLYCQSSSIELTETFVYGFRLAALVIIEVYSEKGRITGDEENHKF